MNNRVVVIGAGGHAKVIADIIIKRGDTLLGFLDDNIAKGTRISKIDGFEIIGNLNDAIRLQEEAPNLKFIIGIGDNKTRMKIANELELNYYTAIHPTANIGLEVEINEGSIVMANACINPFAKIGKHAIINTGAIVEHDNQIGDFAHISPNAVLAGNVSIGRCSHIGVGATIKNNIDICENVIVGAGAVVVKNIFEEGTYIGVPSRKKE